MASSNRCRRRSKLSEHRGHQIPSRRQRFTFDREELSNPWHAPDINECSPYRAFRPIRNNNPKAPLSSFLILLSFYSAIIVFRISHARPSVFTSFFHRGSIKLIASPVQAPSRTCVALRCQPSMMRTQQFRSLQRPQPAHQQHPIKCLSFPTPSTQSSTPATDRHAQG